MAINYRLETAGLHTGYGKETTELTAATLTQTSFTGDWKCSPINPKYTTREINVGGQVGVDKIVTSKVYGELSSFSAPVYGGNEANLFAALGAIVTVNSSPASTDYSFGGSIYQSMATADRGRISNTSLTFTQYDSVESYTITGARPYAFKLGAKNGEEIKLEASFAGAFAKATSSITFNQLRATNTALNVLMGNTLTLGGVAVPFSEIEIDFKPNLLKVEAANNSAGYAQFEIVDLDPTITLSLYPAAPGTLDLWSLIKSNAPVAFVWSFGSGTGNVYTVTAQVAFVSQEASYDNVAQIRKVVLKPVYNSAKTYGININVA